MIVSNWCKKGGVGKTTISGEMGMYLRNKGKRVCIISLDDQNSVFSAFGKKAEAESMDLMFIEDVLNAFDPRIGKDREIDLVEKILIPARENLFLVKTKNTDLLQAHLTVQEPLVKRFKRLINTIYSVFDVILFDYAPSSTRLTSLLLEISTHKNLVIGMDPLSEDGFKNSLQYFVDTEIEYEDIKAIIPNMYMVGRKASKESLLELEKEAKEYLPNIPIMPYVKDYSTIKNLQLKGISIYDELSDEQKKEVAYHDKKKMEELKENFNELFDELLMTM